MPEQSEAIQKAALEWIVGTAARHSLPYQIVGGLAARAHGGTRPLNDIDLYMPFRSDHWPGFLSAVGAHVTWGPASVVEGSWDLAYLKIDHHGQRIEIGDCENLRLRDCRTGRWVEQAVDLDASVTRTVLGCAVDVMPLDRLIAYKRLLGREVDLRDIGELSAARR